MTEPSVPTRPGAPPGTGPGRPGQRDRSLLTDVVIVVLLVLWLAWPVLAWIGFWEGVALWGEQPSPAEVTRSRLFLGSAALCGVVVPIVAAILARGRKVLRVVAIVEAVLMPLAVVAVLLLIELQ
ncbi:hypothetical protein [Georgenia alba]|uniref:Uncharacterized protein n=1 Tax=Georgenia alba TaxID=2233858 RepID=A0ABW2QAC0_9MICO